MSINVVNNIVPRPGIAPGGVRPDSMEEPRADPHGIADRAETGQQPRAVASLPSEAPSGTDPALWSVLTSEERQFFARAQALGPLTYGPDVGRTGADAALRGGRVNVRV